MTTLTPTPVHVTLPEGSTVADLRLAVAYMADDAVVAGMSLRRPDGPPLLDFGRLVIDSRSARVSLDGHQVVLKPRPYAVLLFLAQRAGEALSHDQIRDGAWGSRHYGTGSVTEAVRRVREAIGREWITNKRGFGYRFEGVAR